MLHNILLVAGVQNEISKQGKHINVVLAAGEIRARIKLHDESTFETALVSGMSFPVPQGFKGVSFVSDVSQQTKVWMGDLPLTYSPLNSKIVGSNNIESYSVGVYSDKNTQIMQAKNGRAKSVIYCESDIVVGGADVDSRKGVKISAGEKFEVSTQGALYAYANSAAFPYMYYSDLTGNEMGVKAAAQTVTEEQSVIVDDKVFFQEGGAIKYIDFSTGLKHVVSDLTSVTVVRGFYVELGVLYAVGFSGDDKYTIKYDVSAGSVELDFFINVSTSGLTFAAYNGVNVVWGCSNGTLFSNGVLVHTFNNYAVSCFFSADGGMWASSNQKVVYSDDLVVFNEVFTYGGTDNPIRDTRIDLSGAGLFVVSDGGVRRIDKSGATAYMGAVSIAEEWHAVDEYLYTVLTSALKVYKSGELVFTIPFDSGLSTYPKSIVVRNNGQVVVGASGTRVTVDGEPIATGGLNVAVMSEVN